MSRIRLAALQTYGIFMEGTKNFYVDTKDYIKIRRNLKASSGDFKKLIRREIEFNDYLRQRLKHNKSLLKHLRRFQCSFPEQYPQSLIKEWLKILDSLRGGNQPDVQQILDCKLMFGPGPYCLLCLEGDHLWHLAQLHSISLSLARRKSLARRAIILMEMDQAILREGGVHNMPMKALQKSCYIRGLNPAFVTKEHLIFWLNQWLKISTHVQAKELSLLLHCPLLLGYNEPSNLRLF
ncbi:LETM1 domain-containing protein 1-like isoform X2 [Cylas formicarius]|uniref:LETM1 domain-containing protein 1-like isoform X2 n=1 Tax=Cylas formicarius TaxID=197179 RepID=UPI0029585614|nr:LETM1 domain-containing protein 1-like isoform X2 [Cylas formicarius]